MFSLTLFYVHKHIIISTSLLFRIIHHRLSGISCSHDKENYGIKSFFDQMEYFFLFGTEKASDQSSDGTVQELPDV